MRPLVAVEGLEDVGVALAQEVRPVGTTGIAALAGSRSLITSAPRIGQVSRGVRPGGPVLGRDDAQSFEWQGHTGLLATGWPAMIMG